MTPAQHAAAEGGTGRWRALFADIEAALGDDPSSERAQGFVDRWDALIHEFTQGNREIAEGLARAWSDRANWTAPMKELSESFADRRIWEFIRKARERRSGTREQGSGTGDPRFIPPSARAPDPRARRAGPADSRRSMRLRSGCRLPAAARSANLWSLQSWDCVQTSAASRGGASQSSRGRAPPKHDARGPVTEHSSRTGLSLPGWPFALPSSHRNPLTPILRMSSPVR